ncbi:hypothetical protein EDD29_4297 [Actinocorallia herbida]|uniref:Acetyltransferase (GNAT) family protein n=1 Tax=Actinocorallia herbida TaxID=58109 RepID=A0A3N1CZM0_9ACTN|nr:hypothetical protein [Actinocorallia herbida]ROO86719.1 hypothetical protein EDD29_4297 [Actinocorallia herbida]
MRCRILEDGELDALTRELPVQVWNSLAASRLYGSTLDLVCLSRQGKAVGTWVCPLDGQDPVFARRAFRLLPYASPWVDPELHPSARHRVVMAMAATLMERADAVELPMDPRFGEVAALLEAGADVLCRHTRVLDTTDGAAVRSGYLPTVHNHIRAAAVRHTVERVPPERFDFARAIVGQPAEAVAARRRSGLEVDRDHPTLCLSAVDGDGVCRGQVFVLRSAATAILLHSWFDRDGTRGVPSLLVDAAISGSAAELSALSFDFEGSVIPGIDRFMAGFGARAAAYPQVRWQRSARSEAELG